MPRRRRSPHPPMFTRLLFSFFAPLATSTPMRMATWLLLPPGTPAGTWTTLLLLQTAGTTAYACARPRW